MQLTLQAYFAKYLRLLLPHGNGSFTNDGEKQLSQLPSTQGTSEVEWCDDGDVKGISKQRGEENITDSFEVK